MTLTHKPFEQFAKAVRSQPPAADPLPSPPEPDTGEPHCRLCKRIWSDKPGLPYCYTQHGFCRLCRSPRVRCRCLAPAHWTGDKRPPIAPSQPTSMAEVSCANSLPSVTTVADTQYPKETAAMEKEQPVDAPTTNPKVDFVLNHPGVPAQEVAEKAQASGIELNAGYVYAIRSVARRNGQLHAAKPKPKPKPARAPQPKKRVPLSEYVPKGRPPSERSAFVRTLAIDTPWRDVLRAAKAAKIRGLTYAYVDALRKRDIRAGRASKYGKPMPDHYVPSQPLSGKAHKRKPGPLAQATHRQGEVLTAALAAPRPEPEPKRRRAEIDVPGPGQLSDADIEFMERAHSLGIQRAVVLMQHVQVVVARALRGLREG